MNSLKRTRLPFLNALLITTIALALATVSVPPASAATPAPTSPGSAMYDDAGLLLNFTKEPARFVSLSPSNTEILAALGLTSRLVGVTDVCDYPLEVKNITHIGGYSAISIEKVAAARPDLVFASDITPLETVERLRELGLTVVVIAPRNIDHMIRDIRMIGTLTGTESRAGGLADNLSARLAAVSPCPSAKGRPTVAHIVWHEPLYVSGNNTLQNDVILRAGGENVFAGEDGWGTVSIEEFLMKNPDIIIVNGGGGMDSSEHDLLLEEVMKNPQYASLAAVKNNRVYAVDADIISRPAPRVVDAAEEVARLVHPECFLPDTPATVPSAAPTTPLPAPGFCTAPCILVLALAIACMRTRR